MASGPVRFTLPVTSDRVRQLVVGDEVYLTGSLYVMRRVSLDRALRERRAGRALPFDLKGSAVYNAYPSVYREGDRWRVRFVGPTLSFRMKRYLPAAIGTLGARLVIGKAGAGVDAATVSALRDHGAALLAQVGGCPNYYQDLVSTEATVYWEELGLERVVRLDVENFGPLFVAVDATGREIYTPGSYVVQGL